MDATSGANALIVNNSYFRGSEIILKNNSLLNIDKNGLIERLSRFFIIHDVFILLEKL